MITINKKGFSLIEMVVVMAIIGVLLSIAIPSWNRYRENADLKSAARGIASDFFDAKQRAVGEGVRYQIKFDEENNLYQITNTVTNDTTTKNITELDGPITLTNVTFVNDTIIFFTRGTTRPGTVELVNSRGSRATVRVNITGRTHVSFQMQ